MPVALSSIRDLLKPGLYAVEGKYPMIPTQWSQVFTQRKSTLAVERKVQTMKTIDSKIENRIQEVKTN